VRAKILAALELGAEEMTRSAYNLGNAGLAGKILRAKDLTSPAAVEVPSVSGIGSRLPALGFRIVESEWEFLEMRSDILPIWTVEISQ
jgi:hypothetical protein